MRMFLSCNARYVGILHDSSQRLVAVDVTGMDVVTVAVLPTTGAWSSAVLSVRYANDLSGPTVDYSTPVTLGNTTRGSGLLGVIGRFVVVEVTTAEGADSLFDVFIEARKSGLPVEVVA